VPSLFDTVLVADWSANQSPKRGADSIWWSDGRRAWNPSTREEATAQLRARLLDELRAGHRVLVGFDFPLSFPRGFAKALGLRGVPWRATWNLLSAEIRDEQTEGWNNRFEVAGSLNLRLGGRGPFWGCPAGRRVKGLSARGVSPAPFAAKKRSERCVAGPQSPWKLLGVGTVGSQALLGIPRVRALRDDPALAPFTGVWPFETGFERGDSPIVFAEIYPSMRRVVARAGQVKDEAQVRGLSRWLRTADLTELFAVPTRLSETEQRVVLQEEGWILGVTRTTPLDVSPHR
jgi:precorrin-8X/cobalt-precorrin-8 methylmutase